DERRRPLVLLELRFEARDGRRAGRWRDHDVSLGDVRGDLGHVVQHSDGLRRGRAPGWDPGERLPRPGHGSREEGQAPDERSGGGTPAALPDGRLRPLAVALGRLQRRARDLRRRRRGLDGSSVKSDLFPDVPFSWNPLKFQELEERVRSTREATICALNQMLDLKDLNTGVHSTRLAEWAVRVGQELGMEESGLADIEVAALLHDAGKVGVPDAILKKPGPLDPAEWRVMRMHPEFSWAVLRLVPGLEKASLYALHHHEKFNGSGYPSGLKGDEIPIGARIVSVIDAFDAMVASRPYKEGLPLE